MALIIFFAIPISILPREDILVSHFERNGEYFVKLDYKITCKIAVASLNNMLGDSEPSSATCKLVF